MLCPTPLAILLLLESDNHLEVRVSIRAVDKGVSACRHASQMMHEKRGRWNMPLPGVKQGIMRANLVCELRPCPDHGYPLKGSREVMDCRNFPTSF